MVLNFTKFNFDEDNILLIDLSNSSVWNYIPRLWAKEPLLTNPHQRVSASIKKYNLHRKDM